jgi:hypothetical protein
MDLAHHVAANLEIPVASAERGARTGEMPGPTGPSGLARALLTAGIKREDMPLLGRIVLEYVRPIIGEEAVATFRSLAPVIKD